jgi:uncharacterized protein
MLKNLRKLSSIPFLLGMIGSLFLAQSALSQQQKTFLWKVQSRTATAYILGSVHFLKQENYPLNPRIEMAFDQSRVLVVEANVADANKLDPQQLLTKAFYPENDSLEKHVSRDTYEYLKKEAGKLGMPLELLNRQKPWFLALSLQAVELLKFGFDPRYGVDLYFLSKAQGTKKILELESLDEQINMLSGMSENDQELLLIHTLTDFASLGEQANNLVKAWATGDTTGIESIITKSVRDNPRLAPLVKKLNDDRNKGMVAKIEGYLRTSDTYFVVVGAAHLVGGNGIISALKAKGYTVEQL